MRNVFLSSAALFLALSMTGYSPLLADESKPADAKEAAAAQTVYEVSLKKDS